MDPMEQHPHQHQRSLEETQTASQWSLNSNFTDSAVDVMTQKTHSPLVEAEVGLGERGLDTDLRTVAEPTSPMSPALPANYTDDESVKAPVKSLPPSPIPTVPSDKLRQLAAAAYILEQDDEMTESRRRSINEAIVALELVLADDTASPSTNGHSQRASAASGDTDLWTRSESHGRVRVSRIIEGKQDRDRNVQGGKGEEEHCINESDLYNIHDALASTISSMRLRTQEQKHLHQLAVTKLEAVAQRYIAQEVRLTSVVEHATSLETEVNSLRAENEDLHAQFKLLQDEAQKKSNALTAMGSAMTGLEGWIESNANVSTSANVNSHYHTAGISQQQPAAKFDTSLPKQQTPNRPVHHYNQTSARSTKGRTIMRGQGRFRGRYQVDIDDWGDDESNETGFKGGPARNRNKAYNSNHAYDNPSSYINRLVGRDRSDNFNGYDNDEDPQNFLHDEDDPGHEHHQEGAQDLQDDVKAWIRGCRDVLEYAAQPIVSPSKAGNSTVTPAAAAAAATNIATSQNKRNNNDNDYFDHHQNHEPPVANNAIISAEAEENREAQEDDWGDFERPPP